MGFETSAVISEQSTHFLAQLGRKIYEVREDVREANFLLRPIFLATLIGDAAGHVGRNRAIVLHGLESLLFQITAVANPT